jgi:hypothetical protein
VERQQLIQPSMVLYLDNSPSMTSYRDAVLDSADSFLQQTDLPATMVSFSDKTTDLRNLQDYRIGGQYTNLSVIQDDLHQKKREENIVAALVISDGGHNSGVLSATTDLANQSPLYTVFIGDSSRYPDVAIHDITMPGIVYAGDTITTTFDLETKNIQQQVDLQLTAEAKEGIIHQEALSLTSGEYLRTESISLSFDKPGNNYIQVTIDSLPEERIVQNNVKTRQVTVRPSRYQVLLIADAPSFESRFLFHTVKDMERFEIQNYFIDIDNNLDLLNQFIGNADILYTIGIPVIEMEESSVKNRLQDFSSKVHQVNSRGELENIDISGEIN